MGEILLPYNHYSRSITDDINAIAYPLIRYGITYFAYLRFYNDGHAFNLVTHWESLSHQVNKQYPLSPPIKIELCKNNFHYLPFSDELFAENNPVYRDYAQLFNLGHPIFFIERYKDYTDVFAYSTVANNAGIVNFYLNNLDILEKFKFYFKDKARKLIDKSTKNRILIPEHMRLDFNTINNTENLKEQFINQLDIKNYILPGKNISITKREIETIKNIISGRTIKEVAKQMMISPRTVEDYLNSLRTKLRLQKKSDIIQYISRCNLPL